jgi:serine/threonine protein kinase
LIGIQILERLEWIHSKDIVYRDVKPENFLIGINDPNVIYIVDFGLCKKFRSSKTGKHLLPKLTGRFNGTLKYASPNVVRGKESSRRDDLISLGYMLIHLYKRELPWEYNFCNITKFQYLELVFVKETNAFGELFKGMPKEFEEYIKYTRNLKFEQDPDYSYLRSLLSKVIFNNEKMTFSWINSKNREKLVGIPRSHSRKKTSPQYRILQSLKEERIKRLKRGSTSEININKMTSYFLPKLSEFSTPEQNDNNIYSEKAFNDDNSDLNKNLLTKDSEKEEKIKRVKYSINNSNIKDKAKINDTNNNKEIEKCSKNIKLIFIPKKNIKTRNISIKNSYIKIKNSIPHSNNNAFINNIKKKNLKTVNNKIKNHSKNKLINYNDYYKFNGIISPYNNYKRKISYRKYMESFNIKNLTQNEDNAKKIKLNLSKNIRYKSPLSIKKINTSIRNNNSYKTLNKSNNLFMNLNNSEFNNKFLLPRKRSSKNNINIIINNNIETQKKGILHSNTNIDLGRYFINKSFNQHFNSKNQYKY